MEPEISPRCLATDNSPFWEADYLKVQQFLHGEKSAGDELYREAYPIALRMARKSNSFSVLKEEDIQDIVSEAFQRCLLRMNSFQKISRFSTWVCGFVRYVSLETVRKKCVRQSRLERYFQMNSVCTHASDPEYYSMKRERDTCLWIAFYSLSVRYQALIACLVLDWISISEVKAITGLRRGEMEAELTLAVGILRRRFVAAYYI